MTDLYSNAKVIIDNKTMSLDPGRFILLFTTNLHFTIELIFTNIAWLELNLITYQLFYIELTNLLATSTNFTLLLEAWKGWYDEAPKKMKPLYMQYVKIYNEKARDMGTNELI